MGWEIRRKIKPFASKFQVLFNGVIEQNGRGSAVVALKLSSWKKNLHGHLPRYREFKATDIHLGYLCRIRNRCLQLIIAHLLSCQAWIAWVVIYFCSLRTLFSLHPCSNFGLGRFPQKLFLSTTLSCLPLTDLSVSQTPSRDASRPNPERAVLLYVSRVLPSSTVPCWKSWYRAYKFQQCSDLPCTKHTDQIAVLSVSPHL